MIFGQKFFHHLQLLAIVLILSWRATFEHSTGTKVGIKCLEKEREALLNFKDKLIDEYGELSSWGNEKYKEDCCKWSGVICDNRTNHIVELHLSLMSLRGNISISLLEIQHLKYLDLSDNNFNHSIIPQFIGSLGRLHHLDLSDSNFSGEIPRHLGNLSELNSLSLGSFHSLRSSSYGLLTSTSPDWLSRLNSLNYLHMGSVNLTMATDWLQTISKLTQLQSLSLYNCNLSMVLPLTHLDLSDNQFTGQVPHLALPSSLSYLDLSYNMFNGTVTQFIGSLSKLEILFLDSNNFEGIITESLFVNHSHLQALSLSSNPGISFNISSGWNLPFQLETLYLAGCKVGPHFPTWLRTQTRLDTLDISNAEISDTIPDWFWESSSKLTGLNVSHNNFHGVIPDLSSKFSFFNRIDLSFNYFNGSLPILPSNGYGVDLSSNEFFGSITNLCNETSFDWRSLDLSNNLLSGQLPDCFANLPYLTYLNLAHNNFSGKIPSLNNVSSSLHLQNNSFTGEIPTSLRNCTSLSFIDLSQNKLTGKIPIWVGDAWSELVFLSLRSNEFFGNIPSNLCHLAHLQVLDFSSNKISGGIPKCLNNFTAMIQVDSEFAKGPLQHDRGYQSAFVTWKGREAEYINTLILVKLIDLSSNNLVGDIPAEITDLVMLVGLNLSRNNLSGFLPTNIERLRSLDFLDFSRNHFSSGIPNGVSQLHGLGVLDLSYNNLMGKIPESIHLQTFNASTFEGNPGLCGLPLTKACPGDEIAQVPKIGDNVDTMKNPEDEDKLINDGFYISMAIGFVFGFWGVCGTLVLNNSWRIAFFKLWNSIMDWMYVKIALGKIRLREAYHKFVKF